MTNKLLPFVNKPLEQIKVVGNERTGQLYLSSINGVTPNENPADFQEQQKKQQKFLLRLTQRIKQLAKEQGVPVSQMRKKVMGAITPDANPLSKYQLFVSSVEGVDADFSNKSNIIYFLRLKDTWAIRVVPENPDEWKVIYLNSLTDSGAKLHQYLISEFGQSKTWPITESLTDDQVSKLRFLTARSEIPSIKSIIESEDDDQLFDYLDEQTAELLFNLQEDKARLAIRAATFMLKYRVVYPIVSLSNAVAGSKALHIEAPQHPIGKNVSIRFGPRSYVETSEPMFPKTSQTETLHTSELLFQVNDGDVGFVCKEGSRDLLVGFPDWTENDTRDSIPEELIGLLFEFYQRESGAISDVEEDGSEDEGNLLMPSQNQLEPNLSTGEESGIDSSSSMLETKGSTTRILETSQVG